MVSGGGGGVGIDRAEKKGLATLLEKNARRGTHTYASLAEGGRERERTEDRER